MGTNYYWLSNEGRCERCGRSDSEEIHIGKSSAGWCFSLHIYPEIGINDLPDWIERWHRKGSHIRDEYGRKVTPAEMWAVVMCRYSGREYIPPEWYRQNYARPGPFGLARHTYNAEAGDGPYDRCSGEFS